MGKKDEGFIESGTKELHDFFENLLSDEANQECIDCGKRIHQDLEV
jgi:hypothetical protein